MITVGIAVAPSNGGLQIHCVVLDGEEAAHAIRDAFDLRYGTEDLATTLRDASIALRSRVDSLQPNAVVIRRADQAARAATPTEASKVRLLVEGALAAGIRDTCDGTHLAPGAKLAAWGACDRAALDSKGEALVVAAGHAKRFKEAAAAAIAGFSVSQ